MNNLLLDEILKAYMNGSHIKYIAVIFGLKVNEVIDILRNYARSQRTKGQYSEELKELIAKRDDRDVFRKDIMNELGVSRSLLVGAIGEYGTLYKSKEKDAEELYMNVPEDFEFKECPKCHSLDFNDISGEESGSRTSTIYCKSCGSEFVHDGTKLNIIRWEYID